MSGWPTAKLGDFLQVKHGFAFKSAHFGKAGDHIVLTPGNFREDGGLKSQGEKEKFYTTVPPTEFVLSARDMLLVMTDLTQEARILGSPAIIPVSDYYLHNQRLGKITHLDTDNLEFQYLYHLMNWSHARNQLKATATGTTVRHTAPERIYRVEFPLPPLPVQRRIASILSAYDDLIENNTRRIAILEEMARRLYEEWFVEFRFPGAQGKTQDDLPEGWKRTTLGELADVRWGDTTTTKKSYTEGGFTAYSAAGPDGFLPYHDHERSGIVLSAIGANCGRTWLAHGKWSCIKNTIRFWSSIENVSDEYLFLATASDDFWPKRGAAQPFISQTDARKCTILIPSNEIGQRFAATVQPVFAQVRGLIRKNQNLRAQRDLLLPKLVSGEIDGSKIDAPSAKPEAA